MGVRAGQETQRSGGKGVRESEVWLSGAEGRASGRAERTALERQLKGPVSYS